MAVIKKFSAVKKIQKHLLGIQNLSIQEANLILDEAKRKRLENLPLAGRLATTESDTAEKRYLQLIETAEDEASSNDQKS